MRDNFFRTVLVFRIGTLDLYLSIHSCSFPLIRRDIYREFNTWPIRFIQTIILDNLNTHNPSSFYENMEASAAFDLMNRFEMI